MNIDKEDMICLALAYLGNFSITLDMAINKSGAINGLATLLGF